MSATEQTVQDNMRASLEAAFEKHDSSDDAPPMDAAENLSSETADLKNGATSGATTEETKPAVESASTSDGESDAASEESTGSKPESGLKFEPIEADTATESESTPSAKALAKAPGDWAPAAREHWDALPDEVKVAVRRQTANVGRALRDTTEARDFLSKFEDTVAPFRGLIEASGQDALGATRNLMQAEAGLRLGTPQQKAQMVAQIVQAYGVDVGALDDYLSGTADGADPNETRLLQAIDQRLAPFQRFMGEFHTARETHQTQSRARQQAEIDTFAENHEFFEDVRETMGDLTEMAARRNEPLSLEDAYNRAIALNPEIQRIVNHRAEAANAQAQAESLARKKRAASSPLGEQHATATEKPKDLRGQLEAAIQHHESLQSGGS